MHKSIGTVFYLDYGEVQPPQIGEMGKSQGTIGVQCCKEARLQGEQKQKGVLSV